MRNLEWRQNNFITYKQDKYEEIIFYATYRGHPGYEYAIEDGLAQDETCLRVAPTPETEQPLYSVASRTSPLRAAAFLTHVLSYVSSPKKMREKTTSVPRIKIRGAS